MNKRLVLVSILALTMSACSTTTKVAVDQTPEGNKYARDFGKVEVTFNDRGDWETIKSSATSFVPIENDAGVEQGMNVAAMRAKRNIVEFIQTDLKSSKASETITNALAADMKENDSNAKRKAADLTTKIQEKIAVEANGIVRGAYIVERKVSTDGKNVAVSVQVDKRSMNVASQLKNSFAQ
jgi:hypothetical protein